MGRIPSILFPEHPPADQWNAHRAEVGLAGDAIKGMSGLGRILSNVTKFLEISGRFLAIEYYEISFGEIIAGRDGHRAGQAHTLRPRNCAKPDQYVVDQTSPCESWLVRPCLLLRNRKRELHGDQVLRIESRIGGNEPQEA